MINTLGSAMQYLGVGSVSGARPPAVTGQAAQFEMVAEKPSVPETPVRAQGDVRGMLVDRYA